MDIAPAKLFWPSIKITVETVLSTSAVTKFCVFCFQPSSPPVARSGGRKQRDTKMSAQDTSFDLNKARHEVRQLGVKGLNNQSKEDAILTKLIQLGAKVRDCCVPVTCTDLIVTL